MKNEFVFRLIFLLMAIATPSVVLGQSAKEIYDDGILEMKKKSYRSAIQHFETAREIGRGNKKFVQKCEDKISECRKKSSNPPKPRPKPIDDNPTPLPDQSFSDSVKLRNVNDLQYKTVPVNGEWEVEVSPEEASEWLYATKDQQNKRLLTLGGRSGKAHGPQKAKVRVTGPNFDQSFTVIGWKRESPGPDPNNPLPILSLIFKKKGGKQVVSLPRDSKVEIGSDGAWCFKSILKEKVASTKLQEIWQKISRPIIKLLGGTPQTVLCNENEMVIGAEPNNSGSVRSTTIVVPGKYIINVSQEK